MTNDYSDYGDHGYLTIISALDVITLRCHWPFDVSENEWIDIENAYDAASYRHAVDDALTCGWGDVCGIAGGYLHITTSAPGFTLEFSRPTSGWSASSLRLRVNRPVGELLPEALPFTFACGAKPIPHAA